MLLQYWYNIGTKTEMRTEVLDKRKKLMSEHALALFGVTASPRKISGIVERFQKWGANYLAVLSLAIDSDSDPATSADVSERDATSPVATSGSRNRRKSALIIGAVVVLIVGAVAMVVALRPLGPAANYAGSPSSSAYDPYQYIGINQPVLSQQPCIGLLGLCMGQSIDAATATFGQEADGYPSPDGPDNMHQTDFCHAWRSKKIPFLKVCTLHGWISNIYLGFTSESVLDIALPEDSHLALPQPMASVAQDINQKLNATPFSSEWGPEEGGSGASFSWFYPWKTEGGPEETLTINGDYSQFEPALDRQAACSFTSHSTRELDITTFPFKDVQRVTNTMPITSIEVGMTTAYDKTLNVPEDGKGCRPNV